MITALVWTFFVMSAVLFITGAYGIYTGVVSVLSGGYADNILLGLFFCFTFPVILLIAACYTGSLKSRT